MMMREGMPRRVVHTRSQDRAATPSGRIPRDLTWEAAIELFIQCWRADHPGIRPGTLGHYQEQLVTRIAAFADEEGIKTVQQFDRYALRAFVTWLDALVTYAGKPLSPRGKQMALDTAKRFLLWLYQEHILPDDITAHVGSYRLDSDPEPRATPAADLQKALSLSPRKTLSEGSEGLCFGFARLISWSA